jgi:hypothetical protein
MQVIAETCGCGWETSTPVLGEAANNPEIVLHDLFRTDLLRRFYYGRLLPIEGALSDNWLGRWHLCSWSSEDSATAGEVTRTSLTSGRSDWT